MQPGDRTLPDCDDGGALLPFLTRLGTGEI